MQIPNISNLVVIFFMVPALFFHLLKTKLFRFRIPSAFTLISAEAKNMPDALQLNCQDFSNFKENATLSRINLRNADSGFFIQCFAFHSKMRSL